MPRIRIFIKCYNAWTSALTETASSVVDYCIFVPYFQYYIHSTQTNNINLNDIKTSVYKAIYDYDAKEDDEISFRDGDKFTNCEQIDVGWMIGVHEKSGKHGMFPSNYVEPVDYF